MVASAPEPQASDLRRLLAWWQAARRPPALPSPSVVDPFALRWMLGRLLVVDVLEPLDFRYRLVGANIARDFNVELTGRTPADFPDPAYAELTRRSYGAAVASREPFLARRRIAGPMDHLDYEALILPLGGNERVERLLIGLVRTDAA